MSGGGGSVYIQVTDNDVSRSRTKLLQHRRKRRRFELPRKHRPLMRIIVRCWPALLVLLVVALFLFDSSVILGVSVSSELWKPKPQRAVPMKEVPGNLNRLDPTTRMVNGTRQPCLKLLPPEELQILDLPPAKHSSSPVVRLTYRTRINGPLTVDNSSLLQNNAEARRLNLFTGYQTLAEREESFEVNESVVVHCGFYSENGGFKISDEDKNYLLSCNVVVSTCTFGGGDDLYQPVGMSEASIRKVCYVAFWDEITLRAQESERHLVDEGHMIGRWRIVIVKDLPFVDQRLNGKVPKMLGHRLFPQARFSIWVDSKSQFRRDPLGVLEALLWRTNSVLAISEHGARSSIYDEGKAVVKKNKATPEEVEVQLSQYRQDGFPDDKRFRGKKALSEASVIVREHTPLTNLLMCLWFNEVVRFTSRDQLSFPFVFRKLKALKNVNMFPVCTRKDLVNSMGHRRKAKPLSTV